jgi:invasion protein IalB
VTTNTCDSELIAVEQCTKRVTWTRKLLKELLSGTQLVGELFSDNQSTIAVVSNNGNSQASPQMAKHARFVNELVMSGKMKTAYVPTNHNLADLFTKALGPSRFEQLRDQLCIEDAKAAWASAGSGAVGDANAGDTGMLA